MAYVPNRTYDSGSSRSTQPDPIGLAGGLNLYGYAGGDPINFSDPFGLCPDEKDPKCANYGGAVGFTGLQGTLVLGKGVTVAAGFFSSNAGSGPYLRVGFGFGGDVGAGAELGGSTSLNAFRGSADGGCGGAGGVGGCVTANDAGRTVSGGVSVGTRDIPLPISIHVERSYTFAPTLAEIRAKAQAALARVQEELVRAKNEAYTAMTGRAP